VRARVSCVRVSCVVRACVRARTDVGEGGLEQPLQAVDGEGVYAIGELGTQLGQDAHIHLCARHLDHIRACSVRHDVLCLSVCV
jgi:hypothetical protein